MAWRWPASDQPALHKHRKVLKVPEPVMSGLTTPTPSSLATSSLSVRLLTPWGRGGVAVFEVQGDGAGAVLNQLFRTQSGRLASDLRRGVIAFGRFGESPSEESCLAKCDDKRWELHTHSGRAIIDWVFRQFTEQGATVITPQAARTLEEEVLAAASLARTEKGAALAFYQLDKGLAYEIAEWKGLISSGGDVSLATRKCRSLLESFAWGRRMQLPYRVVLTGPVNVGKSSLLNAIAGYDRALVSELPGVTRDPLVLPTAIAGWGVDFVDTAGLRETSDPIELAGQGLAEQAVRKADLVLEVLDASGDRASIGERSAMASSAAGKAERLVVLNKQDLALVPPHVPEPCILVSAKTGKGIAELLDRVGLLLGLNKLQTNAACLFTPRQVTLLQRFRDALLSGNQTDSLNLLDQVLFG